MEKEVSRDKMIRVIGEELVSRLESIPYDEKDEFDLEDYNEKFVTTNEKNPHERILAIMRKDDKTGKEIYVLDYPQVLTIESCIANESAHYGAEDFPIYVADAGWQEWMNAYSSEEDNLSESELREITQIQACGFMRGHSDFLFSYDSDEMKLEVIGERD